MRPWPPCRDRLSRASQRVETPLRAAPTGPIVRRYLRGGFQELRGVQTRRLDGRDPRYSDSLSRSAQPGSSHHKCGLARYLTGARTPKHSCSTPRRHWRKFVAATMTPPHLPCHANSIDPSQRVLAQRLAWRSATAVLRALKPLIERVSAGNRRRSRCFGFGGGWWCGGGGGGMRWSDPERGTRIAGCLSADTRHTGLIASRGAMGSRQAARRLAHWPALGCRKSAWPVNISRELGCKDRRLFLNVGAGPVPEHRIEISERTLLEDTEHLGELCEPGEGRA